MAKAKGSEKTGGRKKGTQNRQTKALKDMILSALEKAGGKEGGEGYLLKQAQEDPKTFLALVGKVLPLQVTGDKDNPLIINSVHYSKD